MLVQGADFERSELVRYSRNMRVDGFGAAGQAALRRSRIAVVGAGGLGSPVLLGLAAAGVGHITILDDDVVDLSNLQRQFMHRTADVGEPKVLSAQAAVARLNPHVLVDVIDGRLDERNAQQLIEHHDVVVDCTDNFASRYLLSDLCSMLDVPLVWGAVVGWEGQCSSFGTVPSGTRFDLRSIYPSVPPEDIAPTCASAGVLVSTTMTIGATMVAEVVKVITGTGRSLVGRVQFFDLESGTATTVELPAAVGRARVSALQEDYASACRMAEPTVGGVDPADIDGIDWTKDDRILVDVREAVEHMLDGLPHAVSLPPSGTAAVQIQQWSTDRHVYLYCNSGHVARRLRDEAVSLGADADAVTYIRGGSSDLLRNRAAVISRT